MKGLRHRLGHWREKAAPHLPRAKRLAFNLCFYAGFIGGWVLFGAAIAARADGAEPVALALFIWAVAFFLMALMTSDGCRADKGKAG